MFAVCVGQGDEIGVFLLHEYIIVDFQIGISSDGDIVGGAVVIDEFGVFGHVFHRFAG